jgi:TetR/AcrR family transcriptional repressor of mexJK operon
MPSAKRPPRGRPTQSDLEKRKARVLEVASKLFMTHGYAGTSLAEVSKLARVSPRMISAHFGNKADVFTQIILERSVQASLLAAETSSGSTLEEILYGAAKFAWTAAYSPGAISFLRLVVGEGERFETHTAEIARTTSAVFYGEMERIFVDLVDRGIVAISDPKAISKYFIDFIVGFSPPQAAMGYWDLVPDDEEIREKVALFSAALRSTAAAETTSSTSDSRKVRRPRVSVG